LGKDVTNLECKKQGSVRKDGHESNPLPGGDVVAYDLDSKPLGGDVRMTCACRLAEWSTDVSLDHYVDFCER
jgi:hypothetical protein